ncbi:beta-galactosidase [Kribbella shirazensis]|uniref:Beta-galactosidase n=1 Tax=Kribbella shirazensis TaxID=1105143 RepID=A0A7X6A4U0_9ACTN|nr:beta-galactosidase [Kribbella shirazensis]NIK61892.1 beta-galactosidase [Kribbella shirazensis]
MSPAAESDTRPVDDPRRGHIALRSGRIEVDATPTLMLSGEVHYFRLRRDDWADRLVQARDAGLDTIASYIPWIWHELPDGELDLTGRTCPERDLPAFIDLCDSLGLRFLARPGPFVMAELKNEGIPHRIYREHPDAHPAGWDGAAATTEDLDYHHPGFLAAAERWLGAVCEVLAPRQAPDGPVVGVQLDNEVGMLAWVSNTPHLDDLAIGNFLAWLADRHTTEGAAKLLGTTGDDFGRLAAAVRSGGDPARTLAFHQELGLWARDDFAKYLQHLESFTREHGISVPLLINVHGTGGGRGTTFPIGISQLAPSYRGRHGVLAGSDYYLGELTVQNVADLYLCNAILACVNGPDQPATSLEFEVGTGDYGDNLDGLSSPESGVHKTLLTLGQGNRLINYYLLTGGRNPVLEGSEDDGIPRIAFTGERHGFAAPIDPEGRATPAYDALANLIKEVRAYEPILATGRQLTDDLGFGFVADHYLTEYAHPTDTARRAQVDDLVRYRGFGARDALGRAIVLGGYHVDAVDLQAIADPESAWAAGTTAPEAPRTIVLSTPRTLGQKVQQWLTDHVRNGGNLLLTGMLPDRDHDGTPCTILADAFGLSSAGVRADRRDDSGPYWPTVTGSGDFSIDADLRVASAQLLKVPDGATVLLREIGSGLPCAVQAPLGAGSMIFVGCDFPAAHLDNWRNLFARLGVSPRVRIDADRTGLVTVPVASEHGNLLITVNVAPYPITASISVDGQEVQPSTTFPARGHALLQW